ncbi:small-conductance mechanosensitive channel [Terriglobus roseus DSM 18391]|uniref:Small-conductance mechanosensitive channel n=2 Tax=Terriglobus roseus TaxID=392734 RepID=I3ZHA9_TERRK|nr:small-conductance mechanosensitive channel [Terriglobus roseus DSM 18391]
MLFTPLMTLFVPTTPPDASFKELGHSWHVDIVDFVRHDAPKILVILLVSFVLQRIVAFFVNRMRRIADAYAGRSPRASQLRTVAAILRASCYGLIGFIALLQILPLFNIDLKPLLASAGVVGLGISFGAQSLFKDMLNGIFILIEDQFNVGDVVKLAGLTGTVEDLSLRATTLRDGDGTQYFIPNSQIATVSNLSREFSVASLSVSVDASADPDRVTALLREIAAEVRSEPAFKDVAIADADILGVDKINGREVIYPVNIRVKANQKDGILRALRRRILQRFDQEGIPLGMPTSTFVMQGPHDPTVAQPAPSVTEG